MNDDLVNMRFEYERCFTLEEQLTRGRWTVFTALISISFVVAGLSFQASDAGILSDRRIVFTFAYIIFLTAFYFYHWMHAKSHHLRDHLVELEKKMGINIYGIRMERPKLFGIRVYFHWAINMWFVFYTALFAYIVVFRKA